MSEYGKVKIIHLRRKVESPWANDPVPSPFVEIACWFMALGVIIAVASLGIWIMGKLK